MITLNCTNEPAWKDRALDALRFEAFFTVRGILERAFLDVTREAMYRARTAILCQFTRSYIEKLLDYFRAPGDAAAGRLPPRTRQLVGYYARHATSLEAYFLLAQRLCHKGQE